MVDGSLDFDEVDDIGLSVVRFDALASGMSGQLTYELVSGNMDFHNSLFILDANGTLRNKYPFDYESNPLMYAIRVRVVDGNSQSYEKHFILNLMDVNEPPVFTEILFLRWRKTCRLVRR